MMNLNKNHLMWEAVRKEKDLLGAIALVADVGEEAVSSSVQDREAIRGEVHALKKVICGNGDPSHSIVARVEDVEVKVNECHVSIGDIKKSLVGDVATGNKGSISYRIDDLGVRITKLEGSMSNIAKLTWAVVLLILGDGLARIFGLF